MADKDAPISAESLDHLTTAKRGQPRRFVMVCKGLKVSSLVVFKTGALEKHIKEAKDASAAPGKVWHGMVSGQGSELTFSVARADGFDGTPSKNAMVKDFLHQADFQANPNMVLVDTLPDIEQEPDAGAGAGAAPPAKEVIGYAADLPSLNPVVAKNSSAGPAAGAKSSASASPYANVAAASPYANPVAQSPNANAASPYANQTPSGYNTQANPSSAAPPLNPYGAQDPSPYAAGMTEGASGGSPIVSTASPGASSNAYLDIHSYQEGPPAAGESGNASPDTHNYVADLPNNNSPNAHPYAALPDMAASPANPSPPSTTPQPSANSEQPTLKDIEARRAVALLNVKASEISSAAVAQRRCGMLLVARKELNHYITQFEKGIFPAMQKVTARYAQACKDRQRWFDEFAKHQQNITEIAERLAPGGELPAGASPQQGELVLLLADLLHAGDDVEQFAEVAAKFKPAMASGGSKSSTAGGDTVSESAAPSLDRVDESKYTYQEQQARAATDADKQAAFDESQEREKGVHGAAQSYRDEGDRQLQGRNDAKANKAGNGNPNPAAAFEGYKPLFKDAGGAEAVLPALADAVKQVDHLQPIFQEIAACAAGVQKIAESIEKLPMPFAFAQEHASDLPAYQAATELQTRVLQYCEKWGAILKKGEDAEWLGQEPDPFDVTGVQASMKHLNGELEATQQKHDTLPAPASPNFDDSDEENNSPEAILAQSLLKTHESNKSKPSNEDDEAKSYEISAADDDDEDDEDEL